MPEGSDLTRAIARYAVGSRFDALPQKVQREAARAFLNWIGVAIGGCHEAAPTIAARFVVEKASKPTAAVIGHDLKTDVASAAFVNCIASSVLAYDDAHLPTVAHPSGPAASALFALAQSRIVSGDEFLSALALGIEIQCRIANMLVHPPSPMNPSFYVNGFSGPIGVAAAVGRILELDEQRMAWAIGIAASQASGFRAVHGTMNVSFSAWICQSGRYLRSASRSTWLRLHRQCARGGRRFHGRLCGWIGSGTSAGRPRAALRHACESIQALSVRNRDPSCHRCMPGDTHKAAAIGATCRYPLAREPNGACVDRQAGAPNAARIARQRFSLGGRIASARLTGVGGHTARMPARLECCSLARSNRGRRHT